VVGRDVAGLSDEAVSVVGDIVLDVSVAALSDLDLGAIGVGRPEVRNVEVIAVLLGVILHKGELTAWRGLLVPIPAYTVFGLP
jgi:hypothetical protein